jgi:hypothetical protein
LRTAPRPTECDFAGEASAAQAITAINVRAVKQAATQRIQSAEEERAAANRYRGNGFDEIGTKKNTANANRAHEAHRLDSPP